MIIILIFVTHWVASSFFQSFFHHRYASHRMFTMSPRAERVFLALPVPGRDGSKYVAVGRPVPARSQAVPRAQARESLGLPAEGPVVLVFGINSATTRPLALPGIERALGGAWIWVHIGLVLLGIAAFVLNFAGALMYVLQERQLKAKRPGKLYYRLPDLETLDRLTYRTLAFGFPFLTTGLILGVLWAGRAWGSVFSYDPLALLSFVAWAIYAGTLAGRAAAGWRGRRAAYFAIIGFATLVLTLGAGLFLPGRHGS